MPTTTPRTSASRAAAGATCLLGLLLVLPWDVDRPDGGLLGVVLGTAALLTTIKLWCHNCFESRLAAVLLAVASGVGELLALTLGLPGRAPEPVSVPGTLLLLLACTVPLLVLLDTRCRETHVAREPPYAS